MAKETRWSRINRALTNNPTPESNRELMEVSEEYRDFCRRVLFKLNSYTEAEVEDFVSSFFVEKILTKNWRLFHQANKKRKSLRVFVKTALISHVIDTLRGKNSIRRGGNQTHFPIEEAKNQPITQFDRFRDEFDAEWALDHFRTIWNSLSAKFDNELLTACQGYLCDKFSSYQEAADSLKGERRWFEGQFHKVMDAFREASRKQIKETLDNATDEAISDEWDFLRLHWDKFPKI